MAVKTTEVRKFESPRDDMVLELRARCGVADNDYDFVILRREDNGNVHLTVVEDGAANNVVFTSETFDNLIYQFNTNGETIQ